ncbi:cytochrome c [bacterium]|nr:cytochrome c [bacterium]
MSRLLHCLIVVTALSAGCSAGSPEVPLGPDGNPDPELTVGRDLWSERCASCHGRDGGGGSGPKLSAGKVAENFPDPVEQKQLILEGGNGMPAFTGKLSDSETEAVVRYTREVLG